MTSMQRIVRPVVGLALLLGSAWVGACLDDDPLVGPFTVIDPPRLAPIVSDPVAAAAGTRAATRSVVGGSSGTDVVYVSLPPGTVPNGGLATIRNTRTGASVLAAMADGGFDPVPVDASAGDTLALQVSVAGGASPVTFSLIVLTKRRPVVVRTEPPPRKRDVPLNSTMIVVFSEPINPSTVASIRVLQGGASVTGTVVLSADGLRARVQPAQPLAPNTDYTLSVPTGVTDRSGDPLEQAETVEFTTGTTVAVASVATVEPALFVNEFNAQLRTFSMEAILRDDGRVTGSWELFYETDRRLSGRVTCFSIVDTKAAWIAGVVEQAPGAEPDRVGFEIAWRAVDNGPPESGVADQLSFAHPLEPGTVTAQEFCTMKPLTDPDPDAGTVDEIVLHDLIVGDIVVNPSGPPPPPRPPPPPPPPPLPPGAGMSQIAFARGIVWVMNADGTRLRFVTSGPYDDEPAWSPDGTKLVFQSDRGQPNDWDLYVVNWDGSGLTLLTSGPARDGEPAWSPDGTRIAFVRDGLLHLMNADGSGARRLSSAGEDSRPTWGSDTGRIVFASTRSGRSAIYVINTDGSGVVQLTNPSVHGEYDVWPAWSPDGRTIAFQHLGTDSMGTIYVMDVDGSGVRQVALGHRPAWSPDSRILVYDVFGLAVVGSDGSGMRFFGGGPTLATSPAWSRLGAMPPASVPFRSIEKVGGDRQSARVGTTLAEPLTVRVVREDGTPQAGATIRWNVVPQSDNIVPASLSAPVTVTDSTGRASVRLTLRPALDPAWVRAALADGTARRGEVMFKATAVP